MISKHQKTISLLATIIILSVSQAEAARVGPPGPVGPRGHQGKPGPAGAVGPRGATGAVGPAGAAGALGPVGATGLVGPQGPVGPIGATGAIGPAGAIGPVGSFTYSMTCGVSGTDACKIGAIGPGGGWIFFVDYNDQYPAFDYMEVAPTDLNAGSQLPWATNSVTCYDGTSSNNLVRCDANGVTATIYLYSIMNTARVASTAIGMGETNTQDIVSLVGAGTYAAKLAQQYTSGVTAANGTWFLPSKGELQLMFTNTMMAGVGNFLQNQYYWTSSEVESQVAAEVYNMVSHFYGMGAPKVAEIKYQSSYARAIRYF